MLVNPRSATDEFTKYSFPSKTMEYMLSGTPVVMYKLAGIPDEYDEYLNYFDVTSKACIKDKIVEICEMSLCERGMIGNRARQFILTKSNKTQMKKFMDMMKLL
ncbi:MAG: hypothetical protein J6N52_07515 [Clostridia bacterium]|nr:hypothetical protein [Clostridia bacterium]